MNPSTSGFMPGPLVDAIKGELLNIGREGTTRTVHVEFWLRKGQPVEARVRTRESVHIVHLSS